MGKTDLNYTVRVEEAPSTLLRDWLESDVFVELHMSQPKFQFKILEEGQAEPVKDTVLDEDGKPMIETRMLGVSRLNQTVINARLLTAILLTLGDAPGHLEAREED